MVPSYGMHEAERRLQSLSTCTCTSFSPDSAPFSRSLRHLRHQACNAYLGTRSPSRFLLTNTFSNNCSIHVPNLSVHSNNESLALLHFINRSAVLRLHSVPQISPTRLLYQSQLVSATSAPSIMVSLRRSARVSVKSESKGERANDNHTAEVATEPVKRGRKRKATDDHVGSVSTHQTSRQHC